MTHTLLNFVAFQVCWFANVLGAANGVPWAGPLLTAAWMAAHFAALRRADSDTLQADGKQGKGTLNIEARVILAAALLGWLADSALVLAGLLYFPEPARLGGPSPLWMVALWICFAATLRHSLGWLRGRWLLAAALGAIAGPCAYLGGEAFGAIALAGKAALTAVSVQYALATPALLALVAHLQRADSADVGIANTSIAGTDSAGKAHP